MSIIAQKQLFYHLYSLMNLKNIVLWITAATALISCNGSLEKSEKHSKKEVYETLSTSQKNWDSLIQNNIAINSWDSLQEDRILLRFTKEEFNELVNFIEKDGFVITQNWVASDHQYTFFDSKWNRHALMTIKRDINNQPSLQGDVDQISIWAYKDGIKDQEHYLWYVIQKDGVKMMSPNETQDLKDIAKNWVQ